MAARLIASRIAIVRRALREASSAAECLPPLAALLDVAGELREDDLGGTGAARARRLLDEAIRYLRAASAALRGGQEYCVALYLLARACLRRDDAGLVPDADDAIGCLRRLRAALPEDDPDRAEAEVLLADALVTRGVRAHGRAADVWEAGELLTSVLAAVPPEHPGRRQLTAALALALGVRYIGFGGTDADREVAEAYATATLASRRPAVPGEPDDPAATAHVLLAWIALTRQHTAEQRSTMLRQAEVEAARLDGEAAARMLATFGEVRISPADAETAIGHLRQIPPDSGSTLARGSVPLLWALAQLALMRAGAEVPDTGRVAETLGSLAADPETAEIERGELLAMRAALLTGQSEPGATAALGDAASGLPPGHLLRSSVLSMLSSLLSRQVDEAGSADDLSRRLDEVAAVLDRLPHDDPEAAHAMTVLGTHILNTSIANKAILQQDRLFAQIERLAVGLAPGDPLLPLAGFIIWSVRYARARMEHQTERADAALRELIRCAELVPADHVARPFALFSVGIAYVERHSMNGELRNLELADRAINDAMAALGSGGPFEEGTALHGYLLYLRGHVRAARAVYDPSLPRVAEAIEDLERAEAEVGPDEAARLGTIVSLGTARMLREFQIKPPGPDMTLSPGVVDMFDRLLAAAERAGPDSIEYPVLAGQAAGGLMMRGVAVGDVNLVDQAIALLAGVCAIPTLGLRERPLMLELHGAALHTRYSMTPGRDPLYLTNAIARLEEARRAVEQEPGSPHAGSVLQSLARAYRSRGNQALGDVDRAVRIGLAGLRERAGDVLLQDSDDNALNVARQATNDAAEMARWFLTRSRDDAAVSAIELGRGMVLHAATSGAGVAEALTAAGYPELALEWTTQATRPGARTPSGLVPGGYDEPPQDDDLRYRAMLALEGTTAEGRLLSPPTAADIAAALRTGGADALVYLLPQDDTGYGTAVLIDHAGAVSSLPLFRLRGGPGTPVAEFLRTRREMERAATQAAFDGARADWLEALDAVCDWAWQAAMGPLLRTVSERAGASSAAVPGNPRRILLVPCGELGFIPWHAARCLINDNLASAGPARYDYACRHAVISYASSARQFIDATRHRFRPWPQAPVLISDADNSLFFAKKEVAHLYAAHYTSGVVFGCARDTLDPRVLGARTPSPQDVLDALPHDGCPGASVLHFGCHGRVRVPVLGSSLLLGADPQTGEVSVSVSDILRQARTGQAQANDGGLVVLASCLTDVTEADYDEALTLACAFLAAGSAGVVAAKWTVSDAETALFMAAFHRFLNGGHGDPARALREAQLWMLDPDREVPGSWLKALREEASLDGQPGGPNLTSAEAWAGFTYQGR